MKVSLLKKELKKHLSEYKAIDRSSGAKTQKENKGIKYPGHMTSYGFDMSTPESGPLKMSCVYNSLS